MPDPVVKLREEQERKMVYGSAAEKAKEDSGSSEVSCVQAARGEVYAQDFALFEGMFSPAAARPLLAKE